MRRHGRGLVVCLVLVVGSVACSSDEAADTAPDEAPSTEATETTEEIQTTQAVPTTDEAPSTEATRVTEEAQTTQAVPATEAAEGDVSAVVTYASDVVGVGDVTGVVVGVDGTVWAVGTASGAGGEGNSFPLETYAYFDGAEWVPVGSPDPAITVGERGVTGMDAEGGPDGSLWLVSTGFDSIPGVYLYGGTAWSAVRADPFVATGAASPDGSLWALTLDDDTDGSVGLTRYDGTRWIAQPRPEGGIRCLFCVEYEVDDDGTLWMHSEAGLSSFDGERWTLRSPAGDAWALGADGRHWLVDLGALDGEPLLTLMRFDGSAVTSYPVSVGPDQVSALSLESVVGLTGDASGRFWAAIDGLGVWVVDVDSGTTVSYGIDADDDTSTNRMAGLPSLTVRGIAAHPDGSVWVATDNGITRIELGEI